MLGLSSITIGGTTLAMVYCEYKGEEAGRSIGFHPIRLYAVLFVYSYQVCSAVLRTRGDIATIGFVIAVPLLILLLLLLMRFYFKLKAFKRALSAAGGAARPGSRPTASRSIQVARIAVLLPHIPLREPRKNWQFVIWLRQLSLIIAIGIVKFIANLVPEKAKSAGYHYPAAFVFLLIIAVALYAQVKVCPYAYASRTTSRPSSCSRTSSSSSLRSRAKRSQTQGYADTSFSGIPTAAHQRRERPRPADDAARSSAPHPGYRDPNEGGFFAEHWLEVVMVLILASLYSSRLAVSSTTSSSRARSSTASIPQWSSPR